MKKNIVVTELIPTDSHKSFNSRAKIVEAGGRKYLVSYSTVVAGIDEDGIVYRYPAWDSATTRRHVRSFLDTVGAEITAREFWTIGETKAPDLEIEFA